MARLSYTSALDELLTPLGFVRNGRDWTRMVGDIKEVVDLQVSQSLGTTANLYSYDLKTDEILRQVLSIPMTLTGHRVGKLSSEKEHWWRNDPNGPRELAEVIKARGLVYFEERRSLPDQARHFGRALTGWGNTLNRFYLALTLYRMGETGEACEALRCPSKWAYRNFGEDIDALRNWLGCEAPEP